MKKLFIKLVVVVTVMLTVPYYFLGGSLPLPGFLTGMFSETKEPLSATSVRTDRDVTVYKWVDENGRTHFSEAPPVGEVAETMELKTNTNVMQAVKIPDQEEEEDNFGGTIISLGKSSGSKSDPDKDNESSDGELENPYSPEGIENLIDNAKNVSKMMNQRQKQQQQILNGMGGK